MRRTSGIYYDNRSSRLQAGKQGKLTGRVLTAYWVTADRYRVLINGVIAHEGELSALSTEERGFSLPLSFAKDSHLVVEIEGKPSPEYQILYPGQLPYAFSNPIYIDADSNGQWQAPGLP